MEARVRRRGTCTPPHRLRRRRRRRQARATRPGTRRVAGPGEAKHGTRILTHAAHEHVEHPSRKGRAENAQRAGRTPGCIPPISNFEGAVGFGEVWEAKPRLRSPCVGVHNRGCERVEACVSMWSTSHAKGVPKNAQRCGRTPGCIPPISNFECAVGFGEVLLLRACVPLFSASRCGRGRCQVGGRCDALEVEYIDLRYPSPHPHHSAHPLVSPAVSRAPPARGGSTAQGHLAPHHLQQGARTHHGRLRQGLLEVGR
jgi:hypothetical protein